MRVLRFEEDCDAAAVEEAVAEDFDAALVEEVEAALAASAEVREAYSNGSVTVLVLSVVIVVGVGMLWAKVMVSKTVVSPVGTSAATRWCWTA